MFRKAPTKENNENFLININSNKNKLYNPCFNFESNNLIKYLNDIDLNQIPLSDTVVINNSDSKSDNENSLLNSIILNDL